MCQCIREVRTASGVQQRLPGTGNMWTEALKERWELAKWEQVRGFQAEGAAWTGVLQGDCEV